MGAVAEPAVKVKRPGVLARLLADKRASGRQLALAAVALLVLALCVYLHVYRLAATPGWDPQEGYNLDIAWNLLHGRLRLFALTSAFAQHPPLFYLQLALAIRLFGYGIVAIRALAALYAILTCAALLAFGRRVLGAGPALWAGIVFTIAPVMLANTRWGYTYAQLAFVGVLCLWATWRYTQTPTHRWLLLAALLAGLAAFSDYEGFGWVLFVALIAWRTNWRDALVALAAGIAVPLIGLLACLAATPSVFLADFATTFGRATGGNLVIQAVLLLINYYRFVTMDVWLLLGIVGLFLAPPHARAFLLGALATTTLVVLKVRDLGISIHTAVPLLPLLALGAGYALHLALRQLYVWSIGWFSRLFAALPSPIGANAGDVPTASRGGHQPGMRALRQHTEAAAMQASGPIDPTTTPRRVRFAAAAVVFLVVVSPVGIALATDASGLTGALVTRQDTILATPNDARAVTDYVLTHTHDGDLVLASPELAWQFDHPDSVGHQVAGADLLQTLAQSGQQASFYPAGLPASRWAYDVSLQSARYVIVDDLLRQLAAPGQTKALPPVLAEIERWPIAYTRGQYTVYARPSRA